MSILKRKLVEAFMAHPQPSRGWAAVERLVKERERAASEKAWNEGNVAGQKGQRDFDMWRQGKLTEPELDQRESKRANPYRRNEGENE